MKKINNESGFSAVELILVIAVIALLAVVGWMVYKDHHKTSSTTSKTNSATTSSPYLGWASYTLSKEKLTFKYPTIWTISDSTASTDGGDSVVLTGSNGFKMYISTGQFDFSLPLGGATIDTAVPVTFTSNPGFIDLYESGNQKTGLILDTELSKSSTDVSLSSFFSAKYAAVSANGKIQIGMGYQDSNGNPVPKEISALQGDINYKDGILLVKSATY
jgi:hypothetical protein